MWVLLGVGSGSRLTVADMYQQCSYGKTMIDRSQSTVVDWVTIGCSGYGWVGKRLGCGRAVQPDATWQYAAVGWWLRDWQAGLCAPLGTHAGCTGATLSATGDKEASLCPCEPAADASGGGALLAALTTTSTAGLTRWTSRCRPAATTMPTTTLCELQLVT